MPRYLVIDSSAIIFLDRKNRLEDFLRQKNKENCKVIIPEAIAQELVDEPKELAQKIRETAPVLAAKIFASATRVDVAIGQGLIEVQAVDYRKYSRVIDNTRRHLSKIDGTTEDSVKKGDPEIIALISQLFDRTKERVIVVTLDKGLLRSLRSCTNNVQYEILENI
jgi:rRNA-processing protein FCF1